MKQLNRYECQKVSGGFTINKYGSITAISHLQGNDSYSFNFNGTSYTIGHSFIRNDSTNNVISFNENNITSIQLDENFKLAITCYYGSIFVICDPTNF